MFRVLHAGFFDAGAFTQLRACLDIADTPAGLKVVEISSSAFHAGDIACFVDAIERMASGDNRRPA